MKAMVYTGKAGVKYQTVDDPKITDHAGAIVKVTHCSICGSDSQFYHGFNIASEDIDFCIGHETVGEVVEVGNQVGIVKCGDQVMLSGMTTKSCGVCANCKAGKPLHCHRLDMGIYGNSAALHGGQAEAIWVPEADANATIVPEGISNEQAVLLTDTLCTAHFGCKNAEVSPGSVVAVVGLGPIGLMAVELAFVFGARQVFAIDPVGYRRDRAASLGAVPLSPEVAAEHIAEATDGAMAKSVVDAAGNDATTQLSCAVAANRGVVCCVGISHDPVIQFPQLLALTKSLTFRTTLAYPTEAWPTLIPLLQSGQIRPEKLFSHTMTLAEGEKAYELFMERLDDTVKVMLNP